MRPWRNVFVLGAALAIVVPAARVSTTTTDAPSAPAPVFVGFGGSVLVGDGEIFVGEAANLFRPGMVYVYRKEGGGWREAAQLTGPDARVGDRFGSALALDGSRLFIGGGNDAVHLFTKTGTTWSYASTIEPAAVEGDGVQFGAIGAAGDWLLVGQQVAGAGRRGRGSADDTPLPAGKVYAFKRGADGRYTYATTVTSPDEDSAGDGFGASIAMSGTMALVGAIGQANGAGVVHELNVDEAGAWTRARSFAPVGGSDNDRFGAAIALLGEQAIVTAPGAAGYGTAYVFLKVEQGAGRRGGGAAGRGRGNAPQDNFTWAERTRLASPAGQRGDQFASAVAADDREIWIGAPRVGDAGTIFLFPQSDDGFNPAELRLLRPGLDDGAASGASVSVRGDVAAVGATGVNGRAGGLVIYERDGSGAWTEQPLITTALDELPEFTGEERTCTGEGKVEMFECGNTELLAFLPPSKLTHDGHYVEMNDVWGWTDSQTGKEWALVGRRDGTTFVDMSNPTNPVAVADLPLTDGARANSWRDIKVYKDHAYIVADGAGQHGMQVFDLTRLRAMKPQPNGLPALTDYDVLYDQIASAHNIVINEESGFAYSVGSSGGGETCGGGLHMIDIREPKAPAFAGCFADEGTGRRGTGYSHDAQCVTYKGPDERYKDHEICLGANETMLSIADVTDKKNPKAVSRATYPNVAYAHQGWLTEDHKYFFLDDEADEGRGIERTRTIIWDLTDLENPKLVKEHLGVEATSDHNLYIVGDTMYQANYKSGLRILTIVDPENPREVAFFDTAPYTENTPGYNGAWSVYPFFESGAILVNSIEQGLFIVRPTDRPIRR